jgi:hypothetical protein
MIMPVINLCMVYILAFPLFGRHVCPCWSHSAGAGSTVGADFLVVREISSPGLFCVEAINSSRTHWTDKTLPDL